MLFLIACTDSRLKFVCSWLIILKVTIYVSINILTGLSLRGRDWGFFFPGYFRRKIEEK